MTTNHDDDNEDDIDEIEFDEDSDIQDDLDLEAQEPPLTTANARRELEKRLEMKRLRELLDYTEFDDDF
jgi:hypothetical protein